MNIEGIFPLTPACWQVGNLILDIHYSPPFGGGWRSFEKKCLVRRMYFLQPSTFNIQYSILIEFVEFHFQVFYHAAVGTEQRNADT